MTQLGELTLELKRVVPAAPSVVFGAFNAADELAAWWGRRGSPFRASISNPRRRRLPDRDAAA
jgi:uncharacterized protein YndB with AHSA1/START domain